MPGSVPASSTIYKGESNVKKIHFCGEGVMAMLPGWPVCGSGDFALQVEEDGNQSYDADNVTCKRCLKLIAKYQFFIDQAKETS